MMRLLPRRIRRFFGRDDGSATIEFVILFPVFMVLFLSSFELGNVMLRQTMLDRAIDMTVRQIRIGAVPNVNHTTIRTMICNNSVFLTDCMTELRLEMDVVNPRAWAALDPTPDCVNRADRGVPPRRFTAGQQNQTMILRACHLFEPMIPSFGLGVVLGELLIAESGETYRIISSASYVVEPG